MLYKSIIYTIQRKKAITELKESEKRYSNLFHASPQPMWVYDIENLRFVQVNNAAVKHYGYSETEFLKMTILDIRPGDEIEKVIEVFEDKNRHITGGFKGNFKHKKKAN